MSRKETPKDKENLPSPEKIKNLSLVEIEPPKRAMSGRKSSYRESFCQIVIEEMAQGKNIETIAIELGVSRQTFYVWLKKHQEFKEAVEVGKQLSKRWWLEQGRVNIGNKNFNHVLWMMNMTNRFEWTTSKVQAKINTTETKNVNLSVKTIDEKAAEVLHILVATGAIDISGAVDAEIVQEQIDEPKDDSK